MRGTTLAGLSLGLVLALACTGARPSETERVNRAYDGAPPVVPHPPFGAACESCHASGTPAEVPGFGPVPASPHGATAGLSNARCQQCHVFQVSAALFRGSSFEGLRAPSGPSPRAHPLAPPAVPHRLFLREDCLACHAGPAAEESIRTTHPERVRCLQCHPTVASGP